MTFKQWLKIKSSVIDTNNYSNGIFSLFNFLNNKFSLSSRLINIFSSHFFFYKANHKDKESKATYLCKLNHIVLNASLSANTIIVISDASIKNNVATFITHIHSHSSPIKKTLYHTVNVSTTEVKLFAIRYGINQAIQIIDACIIVITDSIYLAYIFDPAIVWNFYTLYMSKPTL